MGKAQRDKGAQGERELAKILNDHGINAHRGYVQFKQSDLVGVDGIHVEVKRQETAKIWEWVAQAKKEAIKRLDGIPVVFFRRNRSEWLTCQSLTSWMMMYRSWQKWLKVKAIWQTPFCDRMAELENYLNEVLKE